MSEKKILSLSEIKAAIISNMGRPASNQNAATALAGTRFRAENGRGEKVVGVVLDTLSPKGKVQAELECVVKDCKEVHIREQSDWHQSVRCRIHSALGKAKFTEQDKVERRLEKARNTVRELEGKAGGGSNNGNGKRHTPEPRPSA